MNTYTTIIIAIDPNDGELKTWAGPYVKGITTEDAEHYCQTHELGYCKVSDILIEEVDFHSGEVKAFHNFN